MKVQIKRPNTTSLHTPQSALESSFQFTEDNAVEDGFYYVETPCICTDCGACEEVAFGLTTLSAYARTRHWSQLSGRTSESKKSFWKRTPACIQDVQTHKNKHTKKTINKSQKMNAGWAHFFGDMIFFLSERPRLNSTADLKLIKK